MNIQLSSRNGTIGQKWPQYKGLSPISLAIKNKEKFPKRDDNNCCRNGSTEDPEES
jgi:hypothetical protein